MKKIQVRNNIKRLLTEKKVSQKKLAENLGITPSHLNLIINYKCIPRIDIAYEIAQQLQAPIEEVFYA